MKSKLSVVLLTSLPISAVFEFVNKYIYSDWDFAKAIAVLIVIDTIMSLVKHWIHRDANSNDFFVGTAKKVFIYLMLMLTAGVVSSYTVNGDSVGTTEWIGDYICVAMVVREVFSIIENSNAILPWLPAWFLKRLKDFNENGEYISKLTNEKE